MNRAQGIVTHLVFTHSLRIRVKAEVSTNTTTATSTPAATSEVASIAEDENASEGTATDDNASEATAASSRAGKKTRESTSNISDVASTSTKVPEMPPTQSPKSSNLVGKINNLVTTDIEQMKEGKDWLMLGMDCYLSCSADKS